MNAIKLTLVVVAVLALGCAVDAKTSPQVGLTGNNLVWDWNNRLSPEREVCFACTALVAIFNSRGEVNGVKRPAEDFLDDLCVTQRNLTRGAKMRALVCELAPVITPLVNLDKVDPTLAPEATCARAKACEGNAAWWDKDSNLGKIAAGENPANVGAPLVDVSRRGIAQKNAAEISISYSSAFSATPNTVTSADYWIGEISYPESICVKAASYFHTCSENQSTNYYVQYLAVGPS